MTYLSQFPGAKYRPRMGRFLDLDVMPTAGVDTKFTILTSSASVSLKINIKGPMDSLIPCTMFQLSETVYNFVYQPEVAGEHEVILLLLPIMKFDFVL